MRVPFACSSALTVVLGSALLGCSVGVGTLPLTPAETPNPARPSALPAASATLSSCTGVWLAPYVVELACEGASRLFVARYDVPVEQQADACARVTRSLYDGTVTPETSTLRLPAPVTAFVVSAQTPTPPFDQRTRVTCLPAREGGMLHLSALETSRGSDLSSLVEVLAWDGLPAGLATGTRPDSLDFLGRRFPVRGQCQLLGAQNLSCAPYGQMSWERFSTLEQARAFETLKVESLSRSGGEVNSDESVACTFEGEATTCRRIVFRMPISKILTLGASNVLIALYATTTVRGTPTQIVCSFYDDQVSEGEIAPLCQEAFELG